MPVSPLINNFNSGEWSPFLKGRVDLAKYASGCERMENFRALPYGPAINRTGSEYIHNPGQGRLRGFIYSTDLSYMMVFTGPLIKFYRNGAYLSGSDVAAPYLVGDVFDLQFLQINDIMYITHGDYPVQKLSRTGSTTFTLAPVDFNLPAFLDDNITDTTITPSGVTGSITLTASAPLWQSAHVGSFWQIRHFNSAGDITQPLTADGTSGTISFQGGYTVRTSGNWEATLLVERSYDNVSWEVVASFSRNQDGNVDHSETQDTFAFFRLTVTDYASDGGDSPVAVLEASSSFVEGLVKITVFNSSTSVDADVIIPLGGTSAVTTWAEGAWSAVRGYPKCVGIFEERIYYANTDFEPQNIWASQVGDYEDMRAGSLDDDGLRYTVADTQQNPIRWLYGEKRLLFATTSHVWTLSGGSENAPVTPSNVIVKRQTANIGSESQQPISLPGVTMYLQRGGRKFRELAYAFEEDSYVAQDMTILSEHVTESKIKQFDNSSTPDSIVYAVRNDGELAVMVYERGQADQGTGNLVAWSRYVTDGLYASIGVIPGAIEDEVWVLVNRGGNYLLERFADKSAFETQSDWFYVDCGASAEVTASATDAGLSKIRITAPYDVSGVESGKYVYRISETAHGLTTGDHIRITSSTFPEIEGGIYSVEVESANVFWLAATDESFTTPNAITNITQASPGVITVTASDFITRMGVFIRGVGGMTQINNQALGLVGITATTFSLTDSAGDYSTAAFSAYTSGGFAVPLETREEPTSGGKIGNVTYEEVIDRIELPTYVSEAAILADGAVQPTQTASFIEVGVWGIVLPNNVWARKIIAGIGYTGYLAPNQLEIPMQTGASYGQKKRVIRVLIDFKDTVGARYGFDENHLEEIQFRSTTMDMDEAIPAFTGKKNVIPPSDISEDGTMLIVQDQPLNCEIRAIATKAEVYNG